MDRNTAYALLGVEPPSDHGSLQAAYRARARMLHPDKVEPGLRASAGQAMAQLNQAWEVVQADLSQPHAASEAHQHANTGDTTAYRSPARGECDLCGMAPARVISLYSTTGIIVWWRQTRLSLELCRLCGEAAYRETQSTSLVRGWWGFIAPIANLVNLMRNKAAIKRHHATLWGRPTRAAEVVSPFAAPVAARPIGARPGPYLATGVAVVIAVGLISTAVDASEAQAGDCLDRSGTPVSCSDDSARFKITGKANSKYDCAAVAFREAGTGQIYCAEPTD